MHPKGFHPPLEDISLRHEFVNRGSDVVEVASQFSDEALLHCELFNEKERKLFRNHLQTEWLSFGLFGQAFQVHVRTMWYGHMQDINRRREGRTVVFLPDYCGRLTSNWAWAKVAHAVWKTGASLVWINWPGFGMGRYKGQVWCDPEKWWNLDFELVEVIFSKLNLKEAAFVATGRGCRTALRLIEHRSHLVRPEVFLHNPAFEADDIVDHQVLAREKRAEAKHKKEAENEMAQDLRINHNRLWVACNPSEFIVGCEDLQDEALQFLHHVAKKDGSFLSITNASSSHIAVAQVGIQVPVGVLVFSRAMKHTLAGFLSGKPAPTSGDLPDDCVGISRAPTETNSPTLSPASTTTTNGHHRPSTQTMMEPYSSTATNNKALFTLADIWQAPSETKRSIKRSESMHSMNSVGSVGSLRSYKSNKSINSEFSLRSGRSSMSAGQLPKPSSALRQTQSQGSHPDVDLSTTPLRFMPRHEDDQECPPALDTTIRKPPEEVSLPFLSGETSSASSVSSSRRTTRQAIRAGSHAREQAMRNRERALARALPTCYESEMQMITKAKKAVEKHSVTLPRVGLDLGMYNNESAEESAQFRDAVEHSILTYGLELDHRDAETRSKREAMSSPLHGLTRRFSRAMTKTFALGSPSRGHSTRTSRRPSPTRPSVLSRSSES